MSFKAGPEMDKDLWAKTSKARNEFNKTILAPSQHNIGRIIMRSPITKLAIAAVVIIACLIGVSLWRTTGSGIALADVLARIEKIKAFRYKWSMKMTSEDPNKPYNFEGCATELISQEYGSITKSGEPGPNGGESTFEEHYFSPQKKTRIDIWHKQKRYSKAELDDVHVEQIQKSSNNRGDPLAYLKEIVERKYKSLGRATIDGNEVEVFQTTDPNYPTVGFKNPQVDVRIWVDVKTRLPVRYEQKLTEQTGDGNRFSQQIVMYDFQWDVPVDAAEFEPPIPDGYTVTVIKLPPNNEETAIQGLKQCVELFGKYPERITDVYQRVKLLLSEPRGDTLPAERLQEEIKGLTEDEIKNKLLMPIRGLERFGCRLKWDNKDPAYYGKTVTPKDADKVLARWKVSDSEYRVIYGDLHAETVTKEKLAELEKALPK